MINKKKVELIQVLAWIKSGYTPAQISKKFSIPKGTLAYHVGKLKEGEHIEKVGYGVWKFIKPLKEVRNQPKGSLKPQTRTSENHKEIRGHAFIWKIEFTTPYDWERTLKLYRKKKLTFSRICNNKVPRTIFNDRKIWLTKKGLTIYEPLDFYGKSSFQVKGTAVFEMDRLIKGLLKELNLKFKPYRFTTSREHYGMIKNDLARQFNDRKEKMHVRGEDGTIWLWIDDSKGLGELETGEPNVSRQVQSYWNNNKKHGFKVDADFILEGFDKTSKAVKKNADHLEYHAENMRSHVGAIRELTLGVKDMREEIRLMREERKSKL